MDSAEQQIVENITSASNILVAVSSNPTVDELSAALGLTLVLDKLDKRATAIFSGAIPPAITFLEPEKTFDNTAESLRDFIIALNKEKADHLRYKVDGDVVKIFITPYKATLSQADLEFSQGDYNIETILALGVQDQDHLDKALDAHGKILHDAKVMTITAGPNTSSLGSTDWHNDQASSLSEMVSSLVNVLKSDGSLLDQQIATALLTGIVSATDRFSNDKTSSQVMTLAAQLMAAGANQQLIAAKLQEGNDLGPGVPVAAPTSLADGDGVSNDGTELTIERDEKEASAAASTPTPLMAPGEKVIQPPAPKEQPAASAISTEEAEQLELEKQLAGLTSTPSTGTMADIEKELQNAAAAGTTDAVSVAEPAPVDDAVAPTIPSDAAMPGFEAAPAPTSAPTPVNDATDQPAEVVHSTAPVGILSPEDAPAMNGTMAHETEEAMIDPFAGPLPGSSAAQEATISPDTGVTTPGDASVFAPPLEPIMPSQPPQPSESQAPQEPLPAQPVGPQIPELPPLPPLPPLPTDGSIPPLPPPPPPPAFGSQSAGTALSGAVSGDIFGDASGTATTPPPAQPAPPSPGQFKIPGQ